MVRSRNMQTFLISIFYLLHHIVSTHAELCEIDSYCETKPGVLEFCPYENGVCCGDGKHCCPKGSTCDLVNKRCNVIDGDSFSLKDLYQCPQKSNPSHSPLIRLLNPSNTKNPVLCPDRKAACPEATTCCQMGSDSWGCCEHANAVCCSDLLHCCPQGYQCNLEDGGCVPSGRMSEIVNKFVSLLSRLPMLQPGRDVTSQSQQLALPRESCPDGRHECPHQTSCCRTDTGSYACCPMPEAVCCADGIHCCPKNTICDMDAGRCLGISLSAIDTLPAGRNRSIRSSVTHRKQLCPDGESYCPEDATCCSMGTGEWGCCPSPEAVCCRDGKHCCPKGFKCDDSHGVCVSLTENVPFVQRGSVANVCPDPSWECENGTTCCQLGNDEWGCCNLPNAVCCKDQAHCCPENYKCDVEHDQCIKSDAASIALAGIHAIMKRLRCTDFGYHCPEHTRCDARSGECVPDTRGTMTWFRKLPAHRTGTETSLIQCGDSDWQCPGNSTCCQMLGGIWACCPMPDAVCCKDQLHCCPHGFQCDDENHVCTSGAQLNKLPATRTSHPPFPFEAKHPKEEPIICPGGEVQCPANGTCCQMLASWACCPAPNAVCCQDGIHCCPEGYTCSDADMSCVRQSERKSVAEPVPVPGPQDTTCPDKRSFCVDHQSCCLLLNGDFGCCPLANGTCCADGTHCCPEGTVCADDQGECIRPSKTGLKSNRIAARRMTPVPEAAGPDPVPSFYRVRFPGQVVRTGWCAECGENKYCCPDSVGLNNRMCCDKAGSMCCADGLHCCPPGTKCAGNGQCDQITEDRFLAPFLIASKRLGSGATQTKSFKPKRCGSALLDPRLMLKYFREYKSVRWTICPDHKHACHLDEQCCPSAEHGYVCAPKTATCCSVDTDFYCPKGSVYDPDEARCHMTDGA